MTDVRAKAAADDGDAPKQINFAINGETATFRIGTERFAEWGLGHIDDRLLDLLDIAGAVFALDGLVTRGGLSRPEFGRRWRRSFDVEMDLRDPSFWNEPSVTDVLVEPLGFLTDDTWSFGFGQCAAAPLGQEYLDFRGPDTRQPDAEHVVLFSGGLDSLAGTIETLEREHGRVVLVSHRSAPKIISRQDALVEELEERYPGRLAYVPIRATFKDRKAPERTQRSRSFLFAAFGYVIARIVGTSRLHFWENGVVSHNLPFSPQIIGTMATRTTHPLALRKFEELLTLVGERAFRVRNDFEWLTKTEVVSKLQTYGATELIATTISCNDVLKRTIEHRHCGACSQCLDRRFAILAAGLEDHEPEGTYQTPVLCGERHDARSRVLALEWTRAAGALATIEPMAFVERFGGELERIARGYAGQDLNEILRRCLALHRRQGETVINVLRSEHKRRAEQLPAAPLPPTSLLIAWMTDGASIISLDQRAARPADPEDPFAASSEDDEPENGLVVRLSRNGQRYAIEVRGLGMVTGAPAGVVFALHPHHEEARRACLAPDGHPYFQATYLIPIAGTSKAAVTQNVRRCRKELALLYHELHGGQPDQDILVQTGSARGYRLDPLATLVSADDASERAAAE